MPFLNICSCWLPSDKGMIFAFVGPMLAIIVVRYSMYYICTVMHGWAGHLQLFLSILTYCVLQWMTTRSLITELNYTPTHICATQVNGILLTISLVSLAKSQCGKVGDSKNDKQVQQYLQTGKWVTFAYIFTWSYIIIIIIIFIINHFCPHSTSLI